VLWALPVSDGSKELYLRIAAELVVRPEVILRLLRTNNKLLSFSD